MGAAAADRFSGLPDALLVRAISFLPAKDAARTTLLERRWRPLWLRAEAVHIDSRSYDADLIGEWEVNNRLLRDAGAALHAPGRCPVRKLSLLATPPRFVFEELLLYMHMPSHPGALPAGQTLRALHLSGCNIGLPPRGHGGDTLFPSLSSLRLERCGSSTRDLGVFLHAAPNLDSLRIENHDFFYGDDSGESRPCLHCPSLTTLSLDIFVGTIHLDAPCLRTFRYKGKLADFCMVSPATNLTRVELALTVWPARGRREPEQAWFAPFWQFLRNLRHAKILKLKVPDIEGIAVDKDVQHEHLATLLNLEQLELELEGPADPYRREDATIAVANLLQSCPVMNSLEVRFSAGRSGYRSRVVAPSDYDVSFDLFTRRHSKEVSLMLDGDDDDFSAVPELPGLTDCWFSCLHNHLKSVKLQFDMKEWDSFEVCLARFFAENCMVLEVLQIEDGNQVFLNHVNHKVKKWRANASKPTKWESIGHSKVKEKLR